MVIQMTGKYFPIGRNSSENSETEVLFQQNLKTNLSIEF